MVLEANYYIVWIENFLIGRQQHVILDGSYSHSHTVDFGIPQGTILAPLLFLCYINDLPSSMLTLVYMQMTPFSIVCGAVTKKIGTPYFCSPQSKNIEIFGPPNKNV